MKIVYRHSKIMKEPKIKIKASASIDIFKYTIISNTIENILL